ncbi:thioredoxin [Candidatus Dependentiae bacterium]|nr:thioredoxin [Candidatus Dependentiae bacterium]MBU4387506.1 thioredoxin [Candidatus Dependentiae bacterium]MCG2756310.1 thioredoxin [Candidatus Dependentiae bacterium]
MAVTVLTSQNYDTVITNSTKPVVIDVFAVWCGPCQYMAPIFEELSKELSDKYTFAKVNIDEERELSIKFNVSSIPTFIFIKNNKIVGRELGFMEKETLHKKIEEYLK